MGSDVETKFKFVNAKPTIGLDGLTTERSGDVRIIGSALIYRIMLQIWAQSYSRMTMGY